MHFWSISEKYKIRHCSYEAIVYNYCTVVYNMSNVNFGLPWKQVSVTHMNGFTRFPYKLYEVILLLGNWQSQIGYLFVVLVLF